MMTSTRDSPNEVTCLGNHTQSVSGDQEVTIIWFRRLPELKKTWNMLYPKIVGYTKPHAVKVLETWHRREWSLVGGCSSSKTVTSYSVIRTLLSIFYKPNRIQKKTIVFLTKGNQTRGCHRERSIETTPLRSPYWSSQTIPSRRYHTMIGSTPKHRWSREVGCDLPLKYQSVL